jgi:hypothetical protein
MRTSAHTFQTMVAVRMATSADLAMYIVHLECGKLLASLRRDGHLQRTLPSKSRIILWRLKQKPRAGLAELLRTLTNSLNRSTLFLSMLTNKQAFNRTL